ncbi:hypothetical protein [Streptomyces kunmingensis]|uniref:hypothetical protein n=1 Tax=Streptomyces kunmingensis TaxID=68225 RepID=UPI003CD080EA
MGNVPFLQNGVVTDTDGVHWAKERVEASGNCTVRILPAPRSAEEKRSGPVSGPCLRGGAHRQVRR